MASNTTRSLRKLRADGWTAEVTEHWNAHARIRQDLFGFGDILALKPGKVRMIQTTSADGVSARVKKIREHENLPAVLDAGIKVVVHGWAKEKNRWKLKKTVVISSTAKALSDDEEEE